MMEEKKKKVSRGYRNCNPGNIRLPKPENLMRDVFYGEIRPSRDKSFRTFVGMQHGYRAMLYLLRKYKNRYGLNTIAEMIARWAPVTENKTDRYIDFVCSKVGMSRDDIVDVSNMTVMCRIVAAMSEMENGIPADMNEVRDGWTLL